MFGMEFLNGWRGGGSGIQEGGGHMYAYGLFIVVCGRDHHNTVNNYLQLI